MFEASALLFLTVETPLHAGMGRGFGAVDLPIQRERTTDYPMVQASSLKGRLRAECEPGNGSSPLPDRGVHTAIFGPDTANAADHAGALAVGDARLLLFPVRSLAGVFAWTTSADALARFQRQAQLVGLSPDWPLPPPSEPDAAFVSGDLLVAGGSIVLEECSFIPRQDQAQFIRTAGTWLAANALPEGEEYRYWREALPQKLCLLPEDAFRDFVRYGTEVQTHVRLDPVTKTVAGGALWTSESLPVDSVLYAPLLATRSRSDQKLSGREVIERIAGLGISRIQLGGDETTGQGIVALRLAAPQSGPGGQV